MAGTKLIAIVKIKNDEKWSCRSGVWGITVITMMTRDEEVSELVEVVRGVTCDAGALCSNALLV